jgi:hypothetical protein
MAIKLRDTQCHFPITDVHTAEATISNAIICGGINKKYELPDSCYYARVDDRGALERRCRSGKADSAFLFLTAVTLIAVGVLTCLRMKKGY